MHDLTEPDSPCPSCNGAPIAVGGTETHPVLHLCAQCFPMEARPKVPLAVEAVVNLTRQVATLKEEVARLECANTAIAHELATIAGAIYADRWRVCAALGATTGIPTEALRSGALWHLVDVTAELVSHDRAMLAARPDAAHPLERGCGCRLCNLERALDALFPQRRKPKR